MERHIDEELKELHKDILRMGALAQEAIHISIEALKDRDKAQAQESVNTLINKNKILVRQLKSLNTRKTNLEKSLDQLQAENTDLKHNIEVAKPQAPQENKESVELPPIVVHSQSEPSTKEAIEVSAAAPRGKVLAINKDSNFVIIDLGVDAGIKTGDKFQVTREDKPIATIEVIQLRKTISACDIKKESSPINVGDVVR